MGDRQQKRFFTRRTVSSESVSARDLQTAEDILARLVARAYAADHPELFDMSGCDAPTRRKVGPQ